ncbi:MAG: adenylate/guanylate cyclase domain-containing protein [Alphaproteobacteria bacterium]
MTVTRRLAAILAADVAGYSRLMAADEAGTLARFKLMRSDHFEPAIRAHGGRLVGEAGDSLLAEFASASAAVTCAVEVQQKLAALNAAWPEDRRMMFRMGVNLGEIIADGATIHGDGVNVAARLEKLAEPGSVIVARAVHDQVKGKVPHRFEDLGDKTLHNIAEPVRAFRVVPPSVSGGAADKRADARDDQVTIAVLPFTNMSGGPEQDSFADGITEDLITALSKVHQFSVAARNSTFVYKGRSAKVRDVGRELGVRYIVEGSTRKGGDRVRVTAQLIDTESGSHVWADRFDCDLVEVFSVQDEIVTAITARLFPKLVDVAARRRGDLAVVALTAYDHYLLGREALHRGAQAEYLEHLLKAVEIDVRFGVAHAGLAFIYGFETLVGVTGKSLDELDSLTRKHIDLALAPGVSDPETHNDLGLAFGGLGEFEKARYHLERARALNPHRQSTILSLGWHTAHMGHHAKGLAMIKSVLALNPEYGDAMRVTLIDAHYLLRDYVAVINDVTDLDNPIMHTRLVLAAALAQLGRHEEAKRAVADFEARRPLGYDVPGVARVYARMSRLPEDKEHWLEGFRKAGLIP